MTHRPFEVFCRNHFVDPSGNVQDINSNSQEAKSRRRKRHQDRLTHQLRVLQRDLGDLYKRGQKAREENSQEVHGIFKRADKVRRRIVSVKKELRKVRKED